MSELEELGFKVFFPQEVFQELKDLRIKVSHKERVIIDSALAMFSLDKVKKVKLGNRATDKGLISMGKKGAYIATLDAAIKREVPNKVFIINAKNSIGIERN